MATVIRATPTRDDLEKARLHREGQWREEAEPRFSTEDGTFEAWAVSDLMYRPRPSWLIDNIVEEEGLTIFFAPDKTGKTAMLSSMLWAWTGNVGDYFLDEQFMFRDPSNGKSRRVLYVLLEGVGKYYDRFDAWRHRYEGHHKIGEDDFLVVTSPVQLWRQGMDINTMTTWPQAMINLAAAIEAMEPQILVVDTLSRATPGADENSSQMGLVTGVLDEFRNSYGISTILVHHTPLDASGKRMRPRGFSGIKAAVSSYVFITGDPQDHVKELHTGPHRNADFTRPVPFKTVTYRDAFVVEAAYGVGAYDPDDPKLELLAVLRMNDDWLTGAEIAPDMPKSTRNDYLNELYEADLIIRKKKGQQYVYMLADDVEDL